MKNNIFWISAYFMFFILSAGCGRQVNYSEVRSLTGDSYKGVKYYFGWGAANYYDPSSMQNEVKYDVLHTHKIFTEKEGGNYIGTTKIGSDVGSGVIKNEWDKLASKINWQDMYVQYSSGHGSTTGLGVGVSYDEIRDNALSYHAKETIIFTMACHSGGLVDSFNKRSSEWSFWPMQKRTLFVMASSKTSQNSSSGPGTDSDEPQGPYGSAGSAFGHSLWKALIGYSDGFIDGVKDGFISLNEIISYTTVKTKSIGGHDPVYTGTFNGNLIMNKVPSKEFILKYATR